MLGHFTVDMYGGILPIMFPVLVDDFSLSKQSVGFIALGFTAAASLSQPFFGYLADRFGSRYFASVSMAWSAVMVGMIGLAPSFAAVVVLAVLAGLGSGAYHPQGASNAAQAVGERGRNSALAFYTVGGTSGFALAPVIGALVLLLFGKGGTILLLPFGLVVSVLLWRQMTRLGLGMPGRATVRSAGMQAIQWSPLVLVVVIVMLRSWVHSSAINFIPLWFDEQGYSAGFYSVLQTIVLGAGAAGTLSGGFLADRYGQKAILLVSLFGSVPLLILFAAFPGPQSFLLGPMFTFTADMNLSVTLVMAQRFLPGRVGMASGFILGMGFVTGGIGVPITGAIADRYGIGEAMMITSVLMVVAGVLAAFIPRRAALPGVRAAREQPAS
jgi:FSR family fosmidomycin resistance protein-like MFS transporter